jgi:hypothetical protein
MQGKRVVLVCCALAIVTGATAAVVIAGNSAGQAGHARNPTLKERAGITAGLPKGLRRDPVGCIYLPIRVSSDGRFARAGVDFLNWQHSAWCVRYTFNGPDWILHKTGSRWTVIAETSGSAPPPPCSLGIPRYLLVRPCRG